MALEDISMMFRLDVGWKHVDEWKVFGKFALKTYSDFNDIDSIYDQSSDKDELVG